MSVILKETNVVNGITEYTVETSTLVPEDHIYTATDVQEKLDKYNVTKVSIEASLVSVDAKIAEMEEIQALTV